jgi:hypothetical protein
MTFENNQNGTTASILADFSSQSNNSVASGNSVVNLQAEVHKEWVEKRGANPEWVKANISWISKKEAEERLGYDPLHDGHWIEGAIGIGQFRPKEPFTNKDGQEAKYITRKAELGGVDIIAPSYPHDPEFWGSEQKIKQKAIYKDGVPCVGVTEGGFKALYLCDHIGASVGLPGCWNGVIEVKDEAPVKGRKKGSNYALVDGLRYLHKQLRLGLIILLDQDEKYSTIEFVNQAIERLGETAGGKKIWVATWDSALGKGVDDVIHAHGSAPIQEAIDKALPFDEWVARYRPKTKKAKLRKLLELKYRGRIRFNLLKFEITLDGRVITPPSEIRRNVDTTTWFDFQATVEEELEEEVNENTFFNAVMAAARKNSFHPVLDYLNHVKALHKNRPYGAIDELCDVLGLKTSIERIQMERHLIGSVKRITHPGCKYDTVPVFFGGQGLNKTTLWEALYSKPFFATLRVADSEKDTIMQTHKFWAVEYGEIDVIYKKKEIEQIKANLSTSEDTYRPPYERHDRTVPRSFVFVGSTNKPEFLLDEENRRFWLLEPQSDPVIDLDKIQQIRDAVWAEAAKKADEGAQFWFVRGTKLWDEQEAMSKRYQLASPFYEKIADALPKMKKEGFSMAELCALLDLNTSEQFRFNQAIAKDLKLLGYTNKGLVNIGDARVKRWRKNDPSTTETLTQSDLEGGSNKTHQLRLSTETLIQSDLERGEIGFIQFERVSGNSDDVGDCINTIESPAQSEKPLHPSTTRSQSLFQGRRGLKHPLSKLKRRYSKGFKQFQTKTRLIDPLSHP